MKKGIVTAFVGSTFILSGCLEDEQQPTMEEFQQVTDEVTSLEESLDEANLILDEYEVQLEELESLQLKVKEVEETELELKKQQEAKEALEEELRKVREDFDDYQKKYEAKVRRAGVGEEFASLEVAGRMLSSVVISSVSETEVKLRHQDGFATLTSATAPEEFKSRFFLRSEEEVLVRAAALEALLNPVPEVAVAEKETQSERQRQRSAYMDQREERTRRLAATKSLGPNVFPALVTLESQQGQWLGFFAQDGITTYLFTTGSRLVENGPFKVVDGSGREWKSFGSIESAPEADFVRIAVTVPVGKALEVHSQGEIELGAPIAAFAISEEGGFLNNSTVVRKMFSHLYECSPGALKGAVGGPVTDFEGKVLGIVTTPVPRETSIWEKEKPRPSRVRPQVNRLDTQVAWEEGVPLSSFLTARKKLERFDELTRLLYAVAALRFGETGANLSSKVEGRVSVEDVFQANQNVTLVQQIISLHKKMRERKMRVSERDLNRQLRSFYQTAMVGAKKQVVREESFPSYFRSRAAVSISARTEALERLTEEIESLSY